LPLLLLLLLLRLLLLLLRLLLQPPCSHCSHPLQQLQPHPGTLLLPLLLLPQQPVGH
jgi:hypothetical protein